MTKADMYGIARFTCSDCQVKDQIKVIVPGFIGDERGVRIALPDWYSGSYARVTSELGTDTELGIRVKELIEQAAQAAYLFGVESSNERAA
jgi:hypothetical protein